MRTLLCLLTTLLFVSSPSLSLLVPYKAEYKLSWQGLPIGQAKYQLIKLGNNKYKASSKGTPHIQLIPYAYNETTIFTLNAGKITPNLYTYRNREKGHWVSGEIDFSKKQANSSHDMLSHVFQLQQDLQNNKSQQSFSYTVLKVNKTRQYKFVKLANENLISPLGKLQAIKLEHTNTEQKRRTILWLAPELNYTLVKLQQWRKNNLFSEITIQKYSITAAK